MKHLVTRVIVILSISLFVSLSVFAQGQGKDLTLQHDVMVNGTMVKKGNYKIVFDEKRGELALVKGNNVVAKAPAHHQERATKANDTLVKLGEKDSQHVLKSITMAGENQTIIVEESINQAVTPQ